MLRLLYKCSHVDSSYEGGNYTAIIRGEERTLTWDLDFPTHVDTVEKYWGLWQLAWRGGVAVPV